MSQPAWGTASPSILSLERNGPVPSGEPERLYIQTSKEKVSRMEGIWVSYLQVLWKQPGRSTPIWPPGPGQQEGYHALPGWVGSDQRDAGAVWRHRFPDNGLYLENIFLSSFFFSHTTKEMQLGNESVIRSSEFSIELWRFFLTQHRIWVDV